MPQQLWSAPFGPPTFGDGPAVVAAALTDSTPQPWKLVPFSSWQNGTQLWLHAQGEMTVASTGTPPTLTLGFYFGTPGSIGTATLIAASQAIALPTSTAVTAVPWFMDWFGEVRALGSAGSVYGMGYETWGGASLTADMPTYPFPATAAARLVTVSTIVAAYLMVGVTLSSTSGSPSVTCRHAFGEQRG